MENYIHGHPQYFPQENVHPQVNQLQQSFLDAVTIKTVTEKKNQFFLIDLLQNGGKYLHINDKVRPGLL